MLKKELIDKVFLAEIPKLREILPKLINRYNRKHLEVDVILSECYIYLIENQSKLLTEKDCKAMIINWVNKNIYWTNSKLNKTESIATIEYLDYIDSFNDEDDEQELDFKILLEENYNKRIFLLSLFREHLLINNKKVLLIVFDTIFKHNIYTGSKLSKQLNINKDNACKQLRILKEEIKLFKIDKKL